MGIAIAGDNSALSFPVGDVRHVALSPDGQWILMGEEFVARPSLWAWPGIAAGLTGLGWGDTLAALYADWEAGQASGENARRMEAVRAAFGRPIAESASLWDELLTQSMIVGDRLGDVARMWKPDLSAMADFGKAAAGGAGAVFALALLAVMAMRSK